MLGVFETVGNDGARMVPIEKASTTTADEQLEEMGAVLMREDFRSIHGELSASDNVLVLRLLEGRE